MCVCAHCAGDLLGHLPLQSLPPVSVGQLVHSRCYFGAQGTFIQERVHSAPSGGIRDLAMPHGFSGLVASCSAGEIRLWDIKRRAELMRIAEPSLDVLCLAIPKVITGCAGLLATST